ncbi:DNA helicase B [Ambystoma mexicanum]|uniref:DNA helicase B n=1 Tax=Ambystoma mexicanum TaxID=8296 RepID=UPI0037E9ABC4
MSQRLTQWSSQGQSPRLSQGRGRRRQSQGPQRLVGVQMLWGALLPRKEPELREGSSDSEDDGGPEEDEDEPQFLDAEEMSGGGLVLKSAHFRTITVIIHDQVWEKKFEVTGRFPLIGPWWEVCVFVKCVGKKYYLKGFPAYFLRTDFGRNKKDVLSIFLTECCVPQDFKDQFFKWLPRRMHLTFHSLEEVLQQFSTAMDPEKGGYNIMKYVEASCTGVNVLNAIRFPLIMEYLPTLLPRLFKNLLKIEQKSQNGVDQEEKKDVRAGLYSNVDVLTKIEEMLQDDPWKLGFSRITYRELVLVRCEATWKAFQQCEVLHKKIQELHMNALKIYDQLKERCREYGDTYVEQDTLIKLCPGMSIVQAWDALEFLKTEEIVVREKDRIFLATLYSYEKDIAKCIEKLMNKDSWHLNIDVEQVLRSQHAKPKEDAVTDDTLDEIFSQLPEMAPQGPDLSAEDAQNDCHFQDTGQENVEGTSGLDVDADQVKAAKLICANPLTIISGKGGCGKTTIVSVIFKHLLSKEIEEVESACKAFESDCNTSEEWNTQSQSPVKKENCETIKVLLTAPTGKAASLLKKKTDLSSYTLHQVTASFYHWRKNGMEKSWKFAGVEALVVDEGSLVSVQIFSSVLKLLCEYAKLAKLVILGDVRQLPSIEPGNMLGDVFQSANDIHWAIELRTNHRAESQLIIDNATRISEQRFAHFDAVVEIGRGSKIKIPSEENKFILVSLPNDGNDDDLQTAVKLLLEKGPGLTDDKTSQFIAFRRVDCDLINELCCQHYSGHPTKNHKNKACFQCHDKVCCTKNAYVKDLIPTPKSEMKMVKDKSICHDQCDVPPSVLETDQMHNETEEDEIDAKERESEERLCNGEIFFITGDVEKDTMRCLTISDMMKRQYELDYRKLSRICNIKHAWARTIHTFQGSEEGTIVYVVGSAGRQDWQHVYTAVTRGRQRVYIVAKEDQFIKAVSNKCRPRKTRLRQRLKETFAQRNDCADPTSCSQITSSQEGQVPSSPIVLSQDTYSTQFPLQKIEGENTIPIACASVSEHIDSGCGNAVYDEMTQSDLEAAFDTPVQKQMNNFVQFPQSPSNLKNLVLDGFVQEAPISCPTQQQENEYPGASACVLTCKDLSFNQGSSSSDRCWTDNAPMATNGNSSVDSFGDLDSELDNLLKSSLCVIQSSSGGDSANTNRKRFSSGEDVGESTSKITRATMDDSPLGCTRLRELSLTTTCQKQLFFKR